MDGKISGYIWFEEILTNAGLWEFDDHQYQRDYATPSFVDRILVRVMHRRYRADGVGGFFPLKNPREDQRGLELWYQISAYVLEKTWPDEREDVWISLR